MMLRTITVEDGTGEVVNAAVLCSFAIPLIDRNILVYTLNEEGNHGTAKVYVTSAVPQENGFRLANLESEQEWQYTLEVLRQITKGNQS
ncbi:hypothetical protein SA496_20125 [Pseudomonas sp. JS3066]|jgi:uncharacterized protein YrzB (UPF0473 family)|uniref:hypothetical protein n=1 Tax=unclassified Pseudomonas TaxID=196821 RepID=UPI000EAABC50|nr:MULTISPECIES: hypothetical protein [unclassified Pseudomonas]AYF90396.1 hypothetical protein D6Z43_25870 [Pseudomonas sp. DY-1]MDH4653021.1 hypothetical protein [Pseudomonas sp. BN606]MRK22796.1 hypothetical protein [Pseudomonas sp. JG-B]WVK92009.1 hypothetical protein SA496_20125 [Pseudomonas sp. JS3066]